MEDPITKTMKNSNLMISNSNRSDEVISDLDILRKAYEIYLENSINFSDELWELLRGQKIA
jgi:hypothetical protein